MSSPSSPSSKQSNPQNSSTMDPTATSFPADTAKDPVESATATNTSPHCSSDHPAAPPPPPPPSPRAQYTPYQQYPRYPAYPNYDAYLQPMDPRSHNQSLPNDQQQQYLQPYPYPVVPQGWMLFRLKGQVEFYFSFENLVRDDFLVQQLLAHGGYCVPCFVVGSFPRVREILGGQCASPQLLQQALQYSLVVGVQGDMLVPSTDALSQALHARRQGPVYHPIAPTVSLETLTPSRYSPQTTSTDDTTTTSSYSAAATHTVLMETPGGTVVNPDLVPPSLTETPPQPMAANWPVGVTQQPLTTSYMPMYNVVNQVPYGYTVTTESMIPETPVRNNEPHNSNGKLQNKNKNQRNRQQRFHHKPNGSQKQHSSSGSSDGTGKQHPKSNIEGTLTPNNEKQNQLQNNRPATTDKNYNGNNKQQLQQATDQKPQQSRGRGSRSGRRGGKNRNNKTWASQSGTDNAGGIALAQGLEGLHES